MRRLLMQVLSDRSDRYQAGSAGPEQNRHAVAAVCGMGNSKRDITVDLNGFGWKDLQVSNWETNKKIPVSADGKIKLVLPRRDFI